MSADSALLGGRYRIDGLIGRGGMATVWRATDTVLDREVAVKRLHARLHGDPELEERFRREGRAVAGLSHPNLVRLLDQGGTDDEPFLVFELVEGQDLKTILRQHGRMAPERASTIVAQVARALAAAHRAGVIHRDIKSHNVMVDTEGTAKLTDFGIARFLEAENNLTRTGIVIGSSDYLAPEQAEGKDVDARSDVYSLGVVLFETLTGRLPFTGENAVAVATKHVYEDAPDPRTFAPDIPDVLADACVRAMHKDPRRRFATTDEFAAALMGEPVDATMVASADDPTTSKMRAVRRRDARGVAGRRRSRSRSGGVVAWVLGLAIVAALITSAVILVPDLREGSSSTRSTSSEPQPIAFTPSVVDPQGDGRENEGDFGNLSDGDPETTWRTEQYQDAAMGKDGVGIKLTFPATTEVTSIALDTPTPGGNLRVLDGTAGDASLADAPALWEGALTVPTTTITIPSDAAHGALTLWWTELPAGDNPEPSNPNRYWVKLGEIRVTGVPAP